MKAILAALLMGVSVLALAQMPVVGGPTTPISDLVDATEKVAAGKYLMYTVQLTNPGVSSSSYSASTAVGLEAMISKVTNESLVSEINSDSGKVENILASAQTGITMTILPVSIQPDGKIATTFSYTIWDKGSPVAKGTHKLKIGPGDSVDLPAFPGRKITLALAK